MPDSRPQAAFGLIPLTPEARKALPNPEVTCNDLPFRVGRDLRGPTRITLRRLSDRRRGGGGANDLYLPDRGPRHRVSREHFLIGRTGTRFFLEDRDSACGTLVEGELVGGRRQGGRRWLRDGDVIIPGGSHSPYVFKFLGPGGDPQ